MRNIKTISKTAVKSHRGIWQLLIKSLNTENKKSAVEFQLIGKLSTAEIEAIFKTAGFEVDDIHVTENKLVR